MGETFVEDFKEGLNVEDVEPLGDLITDNEAKVIAECSIYHKNLSDESRELTILKYNAAFTCMRFVGTPPVDLCNMKWSHDKETHFEYRRQKTGKEMLVPIVPELRNLLNKLPRYSHGYIFASNKGKSKEATFNEEIKRRCKILGINKRVTCYSFRYSATQWSYLNATEQSALDLADIYGHSLETARRHYKRPDVQKLYNVLVSTHPGLKSDYTLDMVKELTIAFIVKLIGASGFQIHLEITPIDPDKRIIHLS